MRTGAVPVFSRRQAATGLVLLTVAAALAVACATGGGPGAGTRVKVAPPVAAPQPPAAAGLTIQVGIPGSDGARVLDLPLEEYVLGVVRAELPPAVLTDPSAAGMVEVQAIVSRTYAIANLGKHRPEGFDLCGGTHCQVYRPPAPGSATDAAARAVAATRGLVIAHEGRVIQALFHADCGGHTASGASVWGGGEPYLAAVADPFCSRKPSAPWTFDVDGAGLASALASMAAADVGPRLMRIDIASRDASGRVTKVTLTGSRTVIVRAEAFRLAVMAAFGDRSLRSTRFTVSGDGRRFTFHGSGFGHGVGLCQAGALARVRAGLSPAEVIAHYFPGTRIERADAVVHAASRLP